MDRTRLFHPWGREPEGGVVGSWRSVSHVVGHGHLLTSGWVPLGAVKARRGSSGTRMGPYGSRTLIRVHRVFRQGSSGAVGPYRPHRPKFGRCISTGLRCGSAQACIVQISIAGNSHRANLQCWNWKFAPRSMKIHQDPSKSSRIHQNPSRSIRIRPRCDAGQVV